MSNYHKILGVSSGATKSQIKNAYRKLAKQYHPDRNKSPDAHEKFLQISEAYEALYEGKIFKKKQSSASRRQSEKEKYWHVYSPPKNPKEREAWNRVDAERRQFYRNRAEKQADKGYENFKKECDAFQKSILFYPALSFYYAFLTVSILTLITILALPFTGEYIDPENYKDDEFTGFHVFVMMIGVLPVVATFAFTLYKIKKIIDPYFKEY